MKTKRMRYSRKRVFLGLFLILLISGIGIGFAFVTTTLSIEGVAKVKDAKWNVHFDNINALSGSVSPVTNPTIGNSQTSVTFSAKLNDPGEFYGFTVDVINEGTINAELDSITITPDFNNVDYVDYSITYEDGTALQTGDLLKVGTMKKIKVYYSYKDGLDDDEYPTTNQTYNITVGLNYVQSVNKNISTFANDSWSTIVTNVISNPKSYDLGEEKVLELDMNNDGEISSDEQYKLRVVNNTTPAECADTGFSQTACGFVVEFIGFNKNSSISTVAGSTSSSVGGYPASVLYTNYLKDNSTNWLYNKFPQDLQNGIIDTFAVSGYEYNKGANYETTDKLYILSPHEIMEDVDGNPNTGLDFYDKSYGATRQLDYYRFRGVTSSNYSKVKKNYAYWTRSVYNYSSNTTRFYYFQSNGSPGYSNASTGNYYYPAFRIGSNS